MAKLGFDAKIGSPQDFATFIAEEIPRWTGIVKSVGVKANEQWRQRTRSSSSARASAGLPPRSRCSSAGSTSRSTSRRPS